MGTGQSDHGGLGLLCGLQESINRGQCLLLPTWPSVRSSPDVAGLCDSFARGFQWQRLGNLKQFLNWHIESGREARAISAASRCLPTSKSDTTT